MAFGFAFVEGKGLKTTTGGKGGKRYEINGDVEKFRTLCDELRDNDNEPSIIILRGTFEFEKGVSNAEIPSNCTVFGEKCSIVGKFEIKNKSNVIIQNIFFKDSTKFGNTHDNIIIEQASHHIWVDHCTFTKTLDGLLDIKKASSYITVSFCKFGKDHNKTMLIGHSDGNSHDDIGNLKVTLHHNLFAGDSRNPRLRHGVVHAVNNYYKQNKSYAIASVLNATVYAQNNLFEDVDEEFEFMRDKYDSDEEGVIFNINNIGVDEDSDDEDVLEELPYSNYSVDLVEDVKEIVEKSAGVQDAIKYDTEFKIFEKIFDDDDDDYDDEDDDDDEDEDDEDDDDFFEQYKLYIIITIILLIMILGIIGAMSL